VKKRSNTLLWLAIALFSSVVIFDIAYGSGTDVEVETTVIGGDQIGGDNSNIASISGSRSYGVSQALGDVDINDCLASTQWGIPVIFAKQTVQENPWCMANSLDAMGAHEAAAKVRCTTKTIKAIYPDPVECEKAVMFHVEPPDEPKSVDRDDENYKRLYARITGLEAERVQDKAKAEKAAKRVNAMAQIAQQAPDDAAMRRAKAREALKGEE